MKEPQFNIKRPIDFDDNSDDENKDNIDLLIKEEDDKEVNEKDEIKSDNDTSGTPSDSSDFKKDKEDENNLDFSKLEKVQVSTENGEVSLYVSKEGNYINEKGEVVYTKEQLEEEVDEYSELFNSIDVKIKSEDGNFKEYDKSIKGVSEYIKDLYDTAVSETLKSNNEEVFKQSLFENYPIVKDVIEHLDKKGSLEGFDFTLNVYSDFGKDDKSIQRSLIRKDKLSKGDKLEEVEDYISYLEDKDKLYDAAKVVQSKFKENKELEEQRNKQLELDTHRSFWGLDPKTNKPIQVENSVYDLLFNKQALVLSNTEKVTIPDKLRVKSNNGFVAKSKADFLKFIYDKKPYKDSSGKVSYYTEYEYFKLKDQSSKNINHEVYDAYKTFLGYDPLASINKDTDSNYKEAVKKLKLKTSDSQENNSLNKQFKLKRQINN